MIKITTFLLTLLSLDVHANLFQIINRTGVCNSVCDSLEVEVNDNLPDADQSNYLKGMANSAVVSQKGLGASYGSNIDFIEIGFTGTIASDLGDDVGTSDLISGDANLDNLRGIGIGAGVTLGLNGALFGSKVFGLDAKRTNFYFYYLSLDPPDTDDLSGSARSFGLHMQYKFIPQSKLGPGLLSWGGVDFTTGLEIASMELQFNQAVVETISDSGATATFDGNVLVGAEVNTYTIPFDISTNFQFLHFLTIFGGVGADLSFGTAKSIASLTGDVTIVGGGGGTGEGVLDLGEESKPDFGNVRGFIGTQINVAAINTFFMLQKGFTNGTIGLSLGLRLAF